jgi:hypothetical protein
LSEALKLLLRDRTELRGLDGGSWSEITATASSLLLREPLRPSSDRPVQLNKSICLFTVRVLRPFIVPTVP